MLRSTGFLFTVAFAIANVCDASIVSWNCENDGDGAITCSVTDWQAISSDEYAMTINGAQIENPGHMKGEFVTNTALDPTIKVTNELENDSPDIWTDYHINVIMNTTFTLSDAFVATPGDWTTQITGAILQTSGLYAGKYLGSVDYYSGTPIPVNGTLKLGYKLSFLGSTSYTYCQEMAYSVPEPSSLILVMSGALLACMAWRRKQ